MLCQTTCHGGSLPGRVLADFALQRKDLTKKKFASLAEDLTDPEVVDRVAVLAQIYAKVDLPFAKRAEAALHPGHVREFIDELHEALGKLQGDSVEAVQRRDNFVDPKHVGDICGRVVDVPKRPHERKKSGLWTSDKASRRRRVAMHLDLIMCKQCGQRGGEMLRCHDCHQWYHLSCVGITSA